MCHVRNRRARWPGWQFGITTVYHLLIVPLSIGLRPPVLDLMVAIVAVRAFALARAGFRYAERLAAHDLAFRVLARLRTWLYRRLEPLLPAGLGETRTGDLLSRLVADIDTLLDVFIRGSRLPLLPRCSSASQRGLAWQLAPAALPALPAPFLAAGIALSWLARRLSRRSAEEQARLRGRLLPRSWSFWQALRRYRHSIVAPRRSLRLVPSTREMAGRGGQMASLGGVLDGVVLAAAGLAVTGVLAVTLPAVRSAQLDGGWLATAALRCLLPSKPCSRFPTPSSGWREPSLRRAESSLSRTSHRP